MFIPFCLLMHIRYMYILGICINFCYIMKHIFISTVLGNEFQSLKRWEQLKCLLAYNQQSCLVFFLRGKPRDQICKKFYLLHASILRSVRETLHVTAYFQLGWFHTLPYLQKIPRYIQTHHWTFFFIHRGPWVAPLLCCILIMNHIFYDCLIFLSGVGIKGKSGLGRLAFTYNVSANICIWCNCDADS